MSDGDAPLYAPAAKKEYKMVREYMMGDVVGEGTQGKVREAVHSTNLRRVAIKIVNLRHLRTVRNAEENMRREVEIHRRLKHVNIVELIEDFRIDEKQKCAAAPRSPARLRAEIADAPRAGGTW